MADDGLRAIVPLLIDSAVERAVEKHSDRLKLMNENLRLIRKGDQGFKGDKGDKGDKGKEGYTPKKGVDYFDGLPGKDGYTPVKGKDYFDGAPGKDGLDGKISFDNFQEFVDLLLTKDPTRFQGPSGKDGTPGARVRGEWKQGERYFEGDLVALGGDWWYADNSGPESRPGRGLKWKLFVRSQAGRLSGYGVVQGQGSGGGSLAIGAAVTGAVTDGVLYVDGSGNLQESAALAANAVVLGGGAGAAPFTDAGLTYDPTTDILTTNGAINIPGVLSSTAGYAFSNDPNTSWGWRQADILAAYAGGTEGLRIGATFAMVTSGTLQLGTVNSYIRSAASNTVLFSESINNTTVTRTCLNKLVSAYSDNVAKASATFTIPNAAHSAGFELVVKGAIGAGGAIGAKEASRDQMYRGVITRTPGLATVVQLSAAVTDITAAVAGATTLAQTVAASAVSGANDATQTFTINVTETKGGGSSDDHTAFLYIEEINDNVNGITVA